MFQAKLALFLKKKKKPISSNPRLHHGLILSFCGAAAWAKPSCHHQYSPA